MKKVGRPKKEGLDKVVKVVVNEQIAEILDNTAKETGKSKSDIIRELIPTISSKNFEEMLSETNMEMLYRYSEECWNLLKTEDSIFETASFSEKRPAVVLPFQEAVYVKYPTFKIQIFDAIDPQKRTKQKKIEELLKPIAKRSSIALSKADYILVGNRVEKKSFPYVDETTCLEETLEENIECKNKIVEILKDEGYNTSVVPAYYIKKIYIELLENGKYFRVKTN